MKHLFLMAAMLALRLEAQPISTPITTYSSLGPGDSYNIGSAWLVDGTANPPQPYVAEAFAFTPTASGYLTQVRLAICANSANLSNDLANISISSNSGANLPGSSLESFLSVPCTGAFGLSNPLLTLTSSAQPFLQSGVTCWLTVAAALPQAVIVVNQNNLGLLASQAQAFSPSAWGAKGNKSTFGFDVTVVPEPSVGALLAVAVTLMSYRDHSRKR